MEKTAGMTCNPKGFPKGPLTNIEDGLEQSVSDQAKERITSLLERIESLSDVEKLLLYLKLPTGSASDDVLRQTPTSFLYASNRLEQAQAFTWIRSHLEEDSQICVPKHEVYDDYRSYCESHGLKALCPADFGKVLKCIFPNVKPRRLGQRGQSRYCYSGLRKKLDIQPPSLPELEISPKKAKTEDLQENELFSASCQLVCEWAGKLLSRGFSSLRELSEFLVGNLYVNSKSTAAFTVLAAMQEAGLHNSRVPVSPLFTCSSGGDKHRETQLQLQRKLQERELFKEQKKKLQQQRSEIEQEQMHSISRGPSATPTKSPLPRSFSKTPTPIRSPGLRPPSSLTLKSPGPVVTFRQTPTPTNSLQKPAKCVSRNITKLLQSPVQSEKHVLPPQEIKLETRDVTGVDAAAALVSMATAATASTATTAVLSPSAVAAVSTAGISGSVETGQGGINCQGEKSSKPTFMVSSVNGMNLLTGSSHQFIISGSQGLILDSDMLPSNGEAAASVFKNGMHVVQKPVVMSANSTNSQPTAAAGQLQAVSLGSVAGSMSSLPGCVSSLSGSVANLSGSVGNMSNISNSSSSASSFDSVQMGQSITIVSRAKESGGQRTSGERDTIAPLSELERSRTESVNFIPGNLSSRSAFVPVSNQKLAFTLIAPTVSTAVPMSESSGDESKDPEDLPVPMDQSESLGSSGGFEPHSENKVETSMTPTSMQLSESSSSSSSQSSLHLPSASLQSSGQKKVKNRFTPIRPKAPQTQPPPPTGAQKDKDQKTPEKDSRPVSALLKEKREKKAREAQEVLQHLASSFQSQTSSGKSFPSGLNLPAEVLGLSPDKGAGGNDVVIILTSPSAGGAKVLPTSRDAHQAEEKTPADKPGSLALSMSDILIANPNFVHRKEPSTMGSSQHQISISYQPIARQVLREKTKLTSDLKAGTAAHLLGQLSGFEGVSDSGEPGCPADEEVTKHMTSNVSSARLMPESRGTDTPSSRKRKSSGQETSNQTHKRLNSTASEKRLEGEDDDVFIVDAPSRSARETVSHNQPMVDTTGRILRRLDVVSPYHRPGSSTFVDMLTEEPVSRCQSTGVGTDEVIYTGHLATELSRQTGGKLNVESLESDALLDSGQLPAPVVRSSASYRVPHLRSLGQKASVGTSAKNLAATQQELRQEKELLDALFLNKGLEQQVEQAPIASTASFILTPDALRKGSEVHRAGTAHPALCAYRTKTGQNHTSGHYSQPHPKNHSVQVHQTSSSVHMHSSHQPLQDNSQSVQAFPSNQPVHVHPIGCSDSQLSSQISVFSKLGIPSPGKSQVPELSPPDTERRGGQVQDASMNVDTFHVDTNINTFLELVHGMLPDQPQRAMAAGPSQSLEPDQGEQQQADKPEAAPMSSMHSAPPKCSGSLMDPHTQEVGSLIHSAGALAASNSGASAQTSAPRPKLKASSSHQPPPNTLLALLQSPVLSAISPSNSVQSGHCVKKAAADKLPSPAASHQEQRRRSSHPKNSRATVTVASQALTVVSPQVAAEKVTQSTSSSGSVLDEKGGHPDVNSVLLVDKLSQVNTSSALLGDRMGRPNMSLMSGGTMTQVVDSSASFSSLTSRMDNSYQPDSTTTLGPIPSTLPANFLETDPQPDQVELGGELPLDVADFVTDYSVKADIVQQHQQKHQQPQQQQQQQQQQHTSLQLQPETLRLDKDLQNFLLQHNASFLPGAVASEASQLAAGFCGAGAGVVELNVGSQKDTFPVPSNPAPKQRLSESGSAGAKKYPPVQRSASLPGFVPRGLPAASNPPDVPPSPTPSPTREPTPCSVGAGTSAIIPARRVRQTVTDRSSSQTLSDGGYYSFDASPLTSVLTPLPPPVSTPTPEQIAVGMTSLRRNPMLSARSDSAQSVSSEGVLSLPQGSPQTSQGVLSNPGSVSACSPVDSAATSPSAFMPIQVSPSSSSAGGRLGLSQHYIQPIRPVVTVASVGIGGQEVRSTHAALTVNSDSASGFVSARTVGLLTADDSADLSRLSQMGVNVVVSDLPQGMSPMETSPASSVQSVKSDPGRLMSASPCPGTVPYNAPSPRRHPGGISPGPSPTPATSNVCSPAPSPGGNRASANHGVLQKLLSTRSAPPSYAESVQQRLMSSNQVIGGFVDQRQTGTSHAAAGIGQGGSVRVRTNSAQARTSAHAGLGSIHTGTSTEPSSQFSLPMMSAEDVKPSARSVVHHVPSTTSAATVPSSAGNAGERSGRRIAILKRDSHAKPKPSSASSSVPKVAAAASDSILKASLASPPSPLDTLEYSRPFSQRLLLLQQMSQSEVDGLAAGGQAKRQQAAPSTASAVLAASLASLKQGSTGGQGQAVSKPPPSPGAASGSGKVGGGASNLAVQVSSPATPGSVSSAPSPASQGQGQMSVPLRISTSTPSHSDIFFGLPASSPSPRVNPFSPQQQSSSSSSSSSSLSSSTAPLSAMYLPFNLPDMNYMGNAPNIDLSQLMPGKSAPANMPGPSQPMADSSTSEMQGLDELHMTLDILRGMDGQYFTGQDVEGEDLMNNVFGELTQQLHATAATSSQEEEDEEGEEESNRTVSRSKLRESSL